LLRLYAPIYGQDPIITESVVTRDALSEIGVPSASIRLIRPGVDQKVFFPDWSLRSRNPLVLSVGRLKRYKDVDLAMQAFKLVLAEYPTARMIVAGDGDDAPRLANVARQLHLGDTLSFTGRVSLAELVRLYRTSWLHVQPSSAEGWGYTVMEAAACGTPSVAFTGTALAESVGPHCRKYLALDRTPESLADSMLKCLRDIARDPDQVSQAALSYSRQFTWESTTAQYESLITATLTEGHGSLRVPTSRFAASRFSHGPESVPSQARR
jgi:glycosyltransferase involved in cell wall biosynthesis